eukprot:1161727-Pelagomonas_calceolata.AAC.22
MAANKQVAGGFVSLRSFLQRDGCARPEGPYSQDRWPDAGLAPSYSYIAEGRTCSPFFWLPAHSVRTHAGYLKRWFHSHKAFSLTYSAGPIHLARHPGCFYL